MSKRVADVIFPNLPKTYAEYEAQYPPRNCAATRFAPSPTGFMHIGGLYTALINCLFAKRNGGVFFLRIEDTDQKRQVENGVTEIIHTLHDFSIRFDEGPAGETGDYGSYGPYRQSLRREIYQAYAKYLLEKDLAYPCFCTEEDGVQLRQRQEEENALQKGYYGKWAVCRNLTEEQVLEKLAQCSGCAVPAWTESSGCSTTNSEGISPCLRMLWTRLSSSRTACPPITLPTLWTTT